MAAGNVLKVGALVYLLAALFNAETLHDRFANLPGDSWVKDIGLAVTGPLLDVTRAVRLDRPGEIFDHARGRNEGGDASAFDDLAGAATTTVPTTVPSTSVPGGSDTTGSAGPGTSGPPIPETTTTAVPPTTAADAGRTPTRDDPLRLYIAGDSDAGALGPSLQRALEPTGLVESTLFYKVSSGLTRPDFFNWPAKLQEDVERLDPDVVVVTFGGNDAQDMLIDGTSYPVADGPWATEYGRRVAAVMDYLSADGRALVWVGIPNAKSDSFTARLEVLERVTQAEAATRSGRVVYIDTWSIFSGRSGGYADFIIDPRDGVGKLVRADDGFHLNQAGADILSLTVAEAVRAEMRARGADV
jgi:hypothetical protein